MMASPCRIHTLLGRLPVITALLLGLLPLQAPAQSLEAKVKAAYIFNLAKYVDWPNLPADAVHICVAGNDPIGSLLTELAGRPVKERPLKVDLNVTGDLSFCQVLYISRSESRWADILSQARSNSVLTVSDMDNFARQGGIIGFYLDAGKVRLEINPASARTANLKISSKLMELARSVP